VIRCWKVVLPGLVFVFGICLPAQADMVGHGGPVRSIDVSPDGSQVLTASFDFTARLFDFVEQRELAVLDDHDTPVNVAIFHPDGVHGVTATDDGTIHIWNLGSETKIRQLTAHKTKVTSLSFSADGKTLVSGGWDSQIIVWNYGNAEIIRSINTFSPVNSVQVLPDGERVAAGLHNGNIRIWRLGDGRSVAELNAHDLGALTLVVSTDGTRVLSGGTNDPARLWDLVTYTKLTAYEIFEGNTSILAISPTAKTGLVADRYGFMHHFDLTSGIILQSIAAHDGPVWAVRFAKNENFALSAGADEVVRVWHLATGSKISFGNEEATERPMPWLESDHPGARVFRKCAGCHATTLSEPQRSGPHFVGLFGRPAGSVTGYRYSKSLINANFAWNDATLTELFTRGPDKYLPGTKMPVQKFVDADSLAHLIDYLHVLNGAE
jgi:cytochrome c